MIFSGDKPLFNRKYLLALVWLLPLAIILLTRLNQSPEINFEYLGPNQLWVQSKDNSASIYFTQGQGLSSESRAKQALLVAGLKLNIENSKISSLLAQQNWQIQPLSSSIYTALEISSETPIDSQALLRLIEELKQGPAVDWSQEISRIDAETYLLAQRGRQRALDALLDSSATPLSARNYLELTDQRISLLLKSPEKPQAISFESGTVLASAPSAKGSVAVRGDQPTNYALWQLPEPTSATDYLAQQAVGALLAQRLAKMPEMRIQQQLSPRGTSIILETGINEQALNNSDVAVPSTEELKLVTTNLRSRWDEALKTRATAWPEVLLLYKLDPISIDEAFEILQLDGAKLIDRNLQHLQQPASRQARILTANN